MEASLVAVVEQRPSRCNDAVRYHAPARRSPAIVSRHPRSRSIAGENPSAHWMNVASTATSSKYFSKSVLETGGRTLARRAAYSKALSPARATGSGT